MRPTKLRLRKEYIIYYHTWTWVVFTGILDWTAQVWTALDSIFVLFVTLFIVVISRSDSARHLGVPQLTDSDQVKLI